MTHTSACLDRLACIVPHPRLPLRQIAFAARHHLSVPLSIFQATGGPWGSTSRDTVGCSNPGNALCVALGRLPKSPRCPAPLAARRARIKKWIRPTAHFALYLPHISALFVFKLRGTAAPPQFQTLDACEIEPYPTLGRGTPETPFFTLSLVRSATPLSFVRYRVVVSPFGQYPKAVLPEGECEEGTPNT